jgi:hypothetical protein
MKGTTYPYLDKHTNKKLSNFITDFSLEDLGEHHMYELMSEI